MRRRDHVAASERLIKRGRRLVERETNLRVESVVMRCDPDAPHVVADHAALLRQLPERLLPVVRRTDQFRPRDPRRTEPELRLGVAPGPPR